MVLGLKLLVVVIFPKNVELWMSLDVIGCQSLSLTLSTISLMTVRDHGVVKKAI